MTILIVEDEKHLADGLKFNLEAEGFDVEISPDGEGALAAIEGSEFDAIVLDVMLPGIDGFDVARTLRENGDHTPILMLTARGRPEDVLRGFEAGTDDYLSKPFDLDIFLARLRGLIRRSSWTRPGAADGAGTKPIEINGRVIDPQNLELRSGEVVHHLTLMEMRLLGYLVRHEGKAVSRKTILEDVWDLHEDTDTRAIDNFIVRLRRYLEDEPDNPKIVRTVRGVGYKIMR